MKNRTSFLWLKSAILQSVFFSFFWVPVTAQLSTTAYSWQAPSVSQSNIVPFCWVGTYTWPGQMYHLSDIPGITAHLQSMPPGKRCLFLWNQHRDMVNYPGDWLRDSVTQQVQGFTDTLSVFHPFPTVWWDSGSAYTGFIHDTLFASLAAAGAPLDMVVLDFEENTSNWTLQNALNGFGIYPADKDSIISNLYLAIAADVRSPAMFTQLGFTDLLKVKNWWQNGNEYLIFNNYWWVQRSAYIQTSIVNPLQQHYPQAKLSNYSDVHVSGDFPVPDLNGHEIFCCANSGTHSGTHQCGAFYGAMGQVCTTNPPQGVTGFDCTPFNALLMMTNHMKSARLSHSAPLIGWIAFHSFQENNSIQYCNSPYYIENIFHLLLSGSEDLLFWNPTFPSGPADPVHWQEAQLVSNALLEFDSFWQTAIPDTTYFYPSDTITAWDTPYILTGMESDSSMVWRYTPRLDSLNTNPLDFLSPNTPLTFNHNGNFLTFPSGAVIDSTINLSATGLWIRYNKGLTGNPDPAANEFCVYPNPFSDKILVKQTTGDFSFNLINAIGQDVYTGKRIQDQNFSDLSPGLYFLKIYRPDSGYWLQIKLVKQ